MYIPRCSFNGAMTLRSWRANPLAIVQSDFYGLQWGHDLAVMESPNPTSFITSCDLLQWGHDLAVMERTAE